MDRRSPQPLVRRALRVPPIAIALVLPLTACVTTNLPPLHEAGRPFSLEEDEVELWKQAHAAAERLDAQRVDDAALDAYLDGIASRLLGADLVRLESAPRMRVLPGTELNAFALPDGSIYFYSTLLTTLSSEDQLAAVLGHELTHFTHRHAVREQRSATNDRRSIGTVTIVTGTILMAAIAGATGVVTDAPMLAMMDVGQTWMVSAVAGYSRDLEHEADDAGFARAVRAGYSPAELIGAFQSVHDATPEAAREGGRVPFYASHPAMRERIERFRELAGALPPQNARDPDRNAYRQAIAAAHAGNARAQLLAWDETAAAASLATYRELRPGDAEGDYLEGWLSQVRGEALETALAHYRAATRANPAHVRAWRRIGLLERRRHDPAAAGEAFRRVLALDPDAPDAAVLENVAESDLGQPSAQLPGSAIREDEPRRVALAPVRTPRGLEIDGTRLREIETDVAAILRARGYEVVDASVYASLENSFEQSVRKRLGPDQQPDSEQYDWIGTHVQNELFARYDSQALMVPIIDAERAKVEDGLVYCRGGAESLPMAPNGTEWDLKNGSRWSGTAAAISLRLVALSDLGRPLLSGTAPCLPLARIDSYGSVEDFSASQQLADPETKRDAVERAVARLRPPPASGS